MKIASMFGAVLFLVLQFLCQAYAIELCEPQDYYNLSDSANKCKIEDNKKDNESGPHEIMFEILKSYPYENKDRFIKLLQRKIELVDNYIKQQQGKKRTGKIKANISKLEQAKQDLSEQLIMVNDANQDNWIGVRDQARRTLKETTRRLHEVE